ncbi:arylamine N-acetyltransferase family protein [Trinickia fusca]|uniref:Arylamine N-acetyltransferase n=1 Tax=Trinickia fusca TaxID=2419777 RepID=A0A494XJF2_9BURK|nr:arylamine N-acetyltransferase [Trinickia fusca]RKP48214.1 arylamine N-acetyltransferase [Trinickia fusca]
MADAIHDVGAHGRAPAMQRGLSHGGRRGVCTIADQKRWNEKVSTRMNIEAYLARINFHSTPEPNKSGLSALQYAHMLSVPFENLDVHLGRKIVLDEAQLFDKIVERRRGGFCYELNSLFASLLTQLGFQVTLIAAQVFQDDGTIGPPFDHLALLVAVGNEQYLVDVGFGDSSTMPLRLSERGEQASGRGVYQICADTNGLTLMKRTAAEPHSMQPLYRFSTTPRQLAEFNEMCIYHQTSERSHFTKKEICSRVTPSGRITISGTQLIETTGESRQVTELRTPEERQHALMQHFAIRL